METSLDRYAVAHIFLFFFDLLFPLLLIAISVETKSSHSSQLSMRPDVPSRRLMHHPPWLSKLPRFPRRSSSRPHLRVPQLLLLRPLLSPPVPGPPILIYRNSWRARQPLLLQRSPTTSRCPISSSRILLFRRLLRTTRSSRRGRRTSKLSGPHSGTAPARNRQNLP